jgi:hypothetical protein
MFISRTTHTKKTQYSMLTDRTMFMVDSNCNRSICSVPRIYVSLKISHYRKKVTINDMYLQDTANLACSANTDTISIKLASTYKTFSITKQKTWILRENAIQVHHPNTAETPQPLKPITVPTWHAQSLYKRLVLCPNLFQKKWK